MQDITSWNDLYYFLKGMCAAQGIDIDLQPHAGMIMSTTDIPDGIKYYMHIDDNGLSTASICILILHELGHVAKYIKEYNVFSFVNKYDDMYDEVEASMFMKDIINTTCIQVSDYEKKKIREMISNSKLMQELYNSEHE